MILFSIFSALNLITFMLIAYDKYLAIKQKKRIPEKTLLIFVLIGGTIGSGLAMLIFRHKTAKKSYLLKFWTTLAAQLFMAIIFLYFYI